MMRSLFSLIELFLGLALIPVWLGLTVGFHRTLMELGPLCRLFDQAVLGYIFVHLFIGSPSGVYDFGKKIMNEAFKFSPSLVAVFSAVMPIYAVFVLLLHFLLAQLLNVTGLERYTVIAVGALLAMHVVLTAEEMQNTDKSFMKGHYLFSMGLVYIVNILIIALLFTMNFDRFHFSKLIDRTITNATGYYRDIGRLRRR